MNLELVRAATHGPRGTCAALPGRRDDGAAKPADRCGWLIGPYIDAHLRVHPDDTRGARAALDGLIAHLDDAAIGSISEVFDAQPPYTAGGCIAQTWGVAELLRCLVKVGR